MAPRTLDDGRGTRELVASTALCGCRIDRALGGRVELVEASRANRRFPLRVTESLGVCLKVGPAHRVMADGCEVVYPEDAICVRPPGCVWSADATGPAGFVSIDLAPSLLPSGLSPAKMAFAGPGALPELPVLVRALRAGGSQAQLEERVAELLLALGGSGLASADELRASAPARISARVRDTLESLVEAPPSLAELADELGTSRFALLRLFKRDFGVTPHAFMLRLRVDRARERLARGGDLGEVALALGFADQPHFTRVFKKVIGLTPGQYARRVRTVAAIPPARTFVQDPGVRTAYE